MKFTTKIVPLQNRNLKKEVFCDLSMSECFKCGVSGEKSALSDAIVKEGVVKVCSSCIDADDLPVIRKATEFDLKAMQSSPSVYDRLSRAAGLNPQEHREKFSAGKQERGFTQKRHEASLRSIVDKNLKSRIQDGATPRADLIDNFHWTILRARRLKKLTQEQVANTIGESESSIKLAEKGVLPPGDISLIVKLENFYRINLRKDFAQSQKPKTLDFENRRFDGINVSDLKRMQGGQIDENALGNELSSDASESEEKPKKKWWKFGKS